MVYANATSNMIKSRSRYFFEIGNSVHAISFSACNIHSELIFSNIHYILLVCIQFLLYYEHMVKWEKNSFK